MRQYNICCISQRKVTKKREENLCVPEKSLQSQIANTLVFLKKKHFSNQMGERVQKCGTGPEKESFSADYSPRPQHRTCKGGQD